MAATKRISQSPPPTRSRAAIVALLAVALVLWLPPRKETRLLAAVSLTAVTPYGASAGVTVQVTGTGFDPTPLQNSITFTPAAGPAITAVADAIATLDATKGLRRLSVKVPAGLAIGTAAVRVVNTTTGESAAGATIQIVALSLPDVNSGTRGAQNLNVRVNGTANMPFVAGRTTVTFGAGITVTSVQVTSATSLIATVTISSTTPLGGRTVLVATSTDRSVGQCLHRDWNRIQRGTNGERRTGSDGRARQHGDAERQRVDRSGRTCAHICVGVLLETFGESGIAVRSDRCFTDVRG